MQFGDPRIPERMWDKIMPELNSGCWLWFGSYMGRKRSTYGSVRIGRKMEYAHRYFYAAAGNIIPETHQVDHKCYNTLCVNPQHMGAVSRKTNLQRARAYYKAARTHCKNGHEMSSDNSYLYGGRKICRACRVAADRRYKNKERKNAMVAV